MAFDNKRYIETLFVLSLMLLLLTGGIAVFLNKANSQKINSISYSQVSEGIKKQVFGEPDMFSDADDHHWGHMPVTYKYPTCLTTFNGQMAVDIEHAVYYFSKKTNFIITFNRIDDNRQADIEFVCDIGAVDTKRDRQHRDGEVTEAEAIINFDTPLIFSPGKIYIYSTYPCLGQRPTMILHEIGHMFNLKHNINPSYSDDIMHPFVTNNCNSDFLDKDIDYLKGLYT